MAIDIYGGNCRYEKYYDTATYTSIVHNTGINTPYYSIFESDYATNGQTVSFYVRSGKTSAECSADTWYSATNGNVVSGLSNRQYCQFKIDMSTSDVAVSPKVDAVRINWTGSDKTVETPMAGIWYQNRYWLSVATQTNPYNDEIPVLDRYNMWTRYTDLYISVWTVYQDKLLGGDSRKAVIWQLETGDNDDGDSITSYWTFAPIIKPINYFKYTNQVFSTTTGETIFRLYWDKDFEGNWSDYVDLPTSTKWKNKELPIWNIPNWKFLQFRVYHQGKTPFSLGLLSISYESEQTPRGAD